jgi:putative transposase
MAEVTKNAPQQAIKNLGTAFQRFFKGLSKYPKLKKKGKKDSFRADPGTDKNKPNAVKVDGNRVYLPAIGWVRMRECIRFPGIIRSVTVSRTANRWFASFTILIPDYVPPARESQAVGGVDVGVKDMAVDSDGNRYKAPKALRRFLKKLRRLSRQHSRKKKGSANRRKSARRLAVLHARIANIRRDALHKATTALVRRFAVLGVEDLHVKGMMKLRALARAIADVGLGEFRRQLTYKAALYDTLLVFADRWYPSSKTCHDCKHIYRELALGEREWTCAVCGVIHDRDLNAALNLMDVAATAWSSLAAACGGGSSGCEARCFATKLSLMKQEDTASLVRDLCNV